MASRRGTRSLRAVRAARANKRRVREENLYKLSLLREVVAKQGWTVVQSSTRRPDFRYRGVNLTQWVTSRRVAYRNDTIADWLVPLLDAIPGWTWDPVKDRQRRDIDNLRSFVRRHGWDALHHDTKVDGVVLADWCKVRRAEYRRRVLPRWIANALAAIPGWSWEPRADSHDAWLRALRTHVARDGWEELRLHTIDRDGRKIGQFVNSVRYLRKQGKLPPWVGTELEAIAGWTWTPRSDRLDHKVKLLRRFVARHGWKRLRKDVVVDGVKLGTWAVACRDRYLVGKLSKSLTVALETIPGWPPRWR